MTAPHHATVVASLLEATATLPGEARRRFLRRACGGDAVLLAEVESLLQSLAAEPGPFDESTLNADTTVADDAAARTPRVPDVLACRYHLQRQIGAGGMAVVYLAHDAVLQRSVALKIQRPDTARSGGRERFDAEIRLTANLRHPNIVSLFDSGGTEGLAFFVMPFIDGETLRDHLARVGRMPVDAAVRAITDVLAALQHAHDAGVVHRDVKPSNVMLESDRALLADFGIAHALDTGQERPGLGGPRAGTPAYMSPEQATGATAIDGRSDSYSVACTLFEMLSGRRPTRAAARLALAEASLDTWQVERAALAAIAPRVNGVIERAAALDPDDRYESAAEFSAELLDALQNDHATGSPQVTVPNATTSAGRAPARRWVRPVVVSAGLLGVIFAGLKLSDRDSAPPSDVPRPTAFDTTRIVVMPYEYEGGVHTRIVGPDRFRSAVARWHGITVVDYARRAAGPSPDVAYDTTSAAAIARSLKAGRYIRRTVSAHDGQELIRVQMFDPTLPRALVVVGGRIGTTASAIDTSLQQLADMLLLTGVPDSVQRDRWTETASRSALVHLTRGMNALANWELPDADSAFFQATTADTGFARAAVWLSLVRLWQDAPPERWSAYTARARAHAAALAPRETNALAVLEMLARGDSVHACTSWQGFARSDSVDFVSWFGAERCLLSDQAVVRDAHSPSGWRFRSSLAQGIRALDRAWTMHPGIAAAFASPWTRSLPSLLLVPTNGTRYGVAAAPDSGRFEAQASWDAPGDSIQLIPYRRGHVSFVTPNAHERGVAFLNSLLLHIAKRAQSNTMQIYGYPFNAVAMDALGSPSPMAWAREGATAAGSASARLAAQVSLVWMLTKYSLPDSLRQLETTRALVDSLIRANALPEPRTAATFASMAVLLGRYSVADMYARRSTDDSLRRTGVAGGLRPSPASGMTPAHMDAADMHRALARLRAGSRESRPHDAAPSSILRETDLLIALADTTAAIDLLAGRLESWSSLDMEWMRSPIEVDALMRAIATYAELLSRTGDRTNALRWSRAISTLWSNADATQQQVVRSLAMRATQQVR